MKENKKKTSREKKVLIGALSLAAVTMASSTFAWFTSKDEVTNRLSANADYNVRIVESFAAPNNWLPGNVTNKDVYATNTGNIPAFVKEEVSGVLTITTEKATSTLTADSVKLTDEERYVMEAGAYLAYKPEGSNCELGNQIVVRPEDIYDDSKKTDFVPDIAGLYVFRRQIVVNKTDRTESFKYEGYYFNGTDFYKISNLQTTPDTNADVADDLKYTDGILTSATAGYYELNQEVIVPDLSYDEANHRLIATYNTGYSNNISALEQAAKRLDDAIAALKNATENVKNPAETTNGTATGTLNTDKTNFEGAKTALQTAVSDLSTKFKEYNDAKVASMKAVADRDALKSELDASIMRLYGKDNGTADDYTSDSLYGKYMAVTGSSNASDAEKEIARRDYYAELSKNDTLNSDYESAVKKVESLGEDDITGARQTAYDAYRAADTDVNAKLSAYNDALTAYTEALKAAGEAADKFEDAQKLVEECNNEKNAAQAEYNRLKDVSENPTVDTKLLKIYINLDPDNIVTEATKNNQWQLSPVPVTNDVAVFYYTGILDAGKTSSKLIDSVELDENTTKEMYKSFDFDLNVKLDSVQVTYDDDDDSIITTDGTEKELKKKATLVNPNSIGTIVKWG